MSNRIELSAGDETSSPETGGTVGAQPLVEFDRVWFGYDDRPVLEDVCLRIMPRQLICVIGPNGGGKTTLVRLLLGLLQPQRGQVRVLGGPAQAASRAIGYMPQHVRFDPLFPISALEVALMGRLGHGGWRNRLGWYSREDRRKARDALAAVGMSRQADEPFASLSGGQRQRVLIARALCCEPQLLVLDEPTANVDSMMESQLFAALRALNDRMAVVVVSHDLGFVSNLAERVICVNRRVVEHRSGPLNDEAVQAMYGSPMRMVDHCRAVSHEGCRHE